MADDSFVDFVRLQKLPRNRVWATEPETHNMTYYDGSLYKDWMTMDCYYEVVAYHKAMTDSEKANIRAVTGHEQLIRVNAISDHCFIPGHLRLSFIEAIRKSLKYKLHCELAMPMIIDSVVVDQYYFNACFFWGKGRKETTPGFFARCDYIHSFKLATNTGHRMVWTRMMKKIESKII